MYGPRGKVRVLIAGRQSLFREAVRVILGRQTELAVVAEVATGSQAAVAAERTQAQLALLHADLPVNEAVQAAKLITDNVADCRVALLANEPDPAVMVKALEAGVTGYLTMDSSLEGLIDAAREVLRGEIVIPQDMVSELIAHLLRRRNGHQDALKRAASLTRREREVLLLLADGMEGQAIADTLVISPQTVRTHIQNLLVKLEVHSRLEAVALVKHGDVLEELAWR